MPAPSIDDMEPQNVSFIESPAGADELDQLPRRLRNLNITSGNRTYRIPHEGNSPSPPRPALLKTFRSASSPTNQSPSPVATGATTSGSERSDYTSGEDVAAAGMADVKTAKLKDNVEADRGFIITFDDVTAPKRPKPQLGVKRQTLASPKKSVSSHSVPSVADITSPGVNTSRMASRVSSHLATITGTRLTCSLHLNLFVSQILSNYLKLCPID